MAEDDGSPARGRATRGAQPAGTKRTAARTTTAKRSTTRTTARTSRSTAKPPAASPGENLAPPEAPGSAPEKPPAGEDHTAERLAELTVRLERVETELRKTRKAVKKLAESGTPTKKKQKNKKKGS